MKKNIFLLKVSGYMVYIVKIFLENFEIKNFEKKKIWKKKSQIFSFGTPLPEKTYLGGPKEKIWKKILKKKYIFIKSFGIYGLYNRFFLENFEKKNLK